MSFNASNAKLLPGVDDMVASVWVHSTRRVIDEVFAHWSFITKGLAVDRFGAHLVAILDDHGVFILDRRDHTYKLDRDRLETWAAAVLLVSSSPV